ATAADFPKTAVLSWEIVRKNNPKDTGVALQLGQALARAGMIARAETVYGELLRADPGNLEIAQALKDLSARRTMAEGGYDALAEGKGSYRDILRNKEEAVALEQEQREVKTEDVASSLIREYRARLEQEPQNLKLLRSLAELHVQKNDLDGALAYYDRLAKQTMGNDPTLDRAIVDIHLRKIDQALAALDPQAPDHAEQLQRIQAQRQEFQLNECRQRVERYPNDLAIRFEMGQLCYRAGRITEAIQEFQKSQANPHMRIPSLYHLGLCFSKRGLSDLAARTLQNAIKEKVGFDDERKELIYALGCVFEGMGQREQAIEQFKQIYEVDIGYKDVAAKVDAFYEQQSSGT
ncbi:MAG TPA: tetratricopeptide repeat protein, partial [Candidatus Paceibacterota bacterium]|nr:tetratricopeptide repeat protein [Candidatus Paceibacterota bacterium]